MNTNKNISEDSLHELFSGFSLDEPSPDFSEKLLQRIEKEVLREKRKQQWLLVGQISAGVLSILFLPALVIYLCTIFFPDFSFSFPKLHLNLKFDLNLLTIGFSVLILLILDTLFRMYVAKHRKRDS